MESVSLMTLMAFNKNCSGQKIRWALGPPYISLVALILLYWIDYRPVSTLQTVSLPAGMELFQNTTLPYCLF